jgi:hypothetical protein
VLVSEIVVGRLQPSSVSKPAGAIRIGALEAVRNPNLEGNAVQHVD